MKNLKKLCVAGLMTVMCLSALCACKPSDVTDALPIPSEGDSEFKEAEGDWTGIMEKTDDYTSLFADNGTNFTIKIYKEDGAYRIDFVDIYPEGGALEVYGKKLELVKEALYADCENREWYAKAFERSGENYTATYCLTMLDDDTLELMSKTVYDYEDGQNVYTEHNIFKRADSDIEAAINEYRYKDTITVSNIKEFYNVLGSNRRIILKEGTYNFSELPEEDRDSSNEEINWRYSYDENDEYNFAYSPADQAYLYCVRNLIIEGEEGAEVHICTEDPYLAPLEFSGADHITLKNLKIGHAVEQGFCTGAVTTFSSCNKVNIDNCRLYGCGTYGV